MQEKKIHTLSGAAIAMAAAGLFSGCQTTSSDSAAAAPVVATADLVHCYGVNACKGHNDCKTANNACAGQAECKGHGFVAIPEKSCGNVGGETGA